MDFKQLVFKRRSIRKFTTAAVPEEKIMSILEAGQWAPSAGNWQPWHFMVVTDKDLKRWIADNSTKYSREHWKRFTPERAKYLAERGETWNKSNMKDIPVLLIVTYEPRSGYWSELVLGSVWMAVENMLLAATEEGLASCVYTFLNKREENALKQILQVPKNRRIACMIQIGYADAQVVRPVRKKLEEIVSYR